MLIMKQTTNNRKQAANIGTADYYAKKLNSTKKMAVSFRIGSRVIVLVKNGSFWDMSNGDGTGTQYDMTTQEAADVLALDYQDAQREAVTLETISRDRYGIDYTADGLEFRAVVVENETGEELAAFLNIEDAHASHWYGYRLEADEDAHDDEGSRGARLLFQCCREEDAGTSRIAYGNSYEQAAANYRAGNFGTEQPQQQEREARARRIATTILQQIKAAPADIWQSWAMEHPAATIWEGRASLIFRVNGLQHRGSVIVTLDEGRDLYDIRTLSDKGDTIEERRGIFCDDLTHVIDTMVERPEGMTDAEYTAALRALNDPLTNFLLTKAEQGQRAHVVQL